MYNKITLHNNLEPIYDICFYNSFDYLAEELKKIGVFEKKMCIVSDTNVSQYYLSMIKDILNKLSPCVISYVFTAGEESKNLDIVNELYEQLIISKFDRNDYLIALGGGVVGDLTGFCAATYLRGISFIQIPTSLLSQVDSSIGGKTGVDFKNYKNMVGAFYQPKLVYMNLSTLNSLNDREYYSGLAEIIKHGLICDREYFNWISDNVLEIKNRNIEVLKEMIYRSCLIKQNVVEKDPYEEGIRAFLNFGHTLGHAIEKLMDFKLLHGECVAAGMVMASFISQNRGYITMEEYEGIYKLINEFNLPVKITCLLYEDIIEATKNDKKMDSGKIKFILLKEIGKAVIVKDLTDEEMLNAIKNCS